MREEYDSIKTGKLDLDGVTAREMLSVIASMFYTAPEGSDPFLDMQFNDEMGQGCIMRMYLVEHPDAYNTIH